MGNTIYKYKINYRGVTKVTMPSNAQLLSAHHQDGDICIWAMVNTKTNYTKERSFEVFYTGEELSDDLRTFVGTVIIGHTVFHVFERISQ